MPALRLKTVAEVGAYPSMVGPAIPSFTPLMVTGCYRLAAVSWEIVNVYTNTMATDAYRGAGRPEAAYIIERVMDAVAVATGLDPAEVRSRNFVLNPGYQMAPYPCTVEVEVDRPEGTIPHYLPGTNPFLTEWAEKHHLPLDAAKGGGETMYPEYMLKLKTLPSAKPRAAQ